MLDRFSRQASRQDERTGDFSQVFPVLGLSPTPGGINEDFVVGKTIRFHRRGGNEKGFLKERNLGFMVQTVQLTGTDRGHTLHDR